MNPDATALIRAIPTIADCRLLAAQLWHTADPEGLLSPARARAVLRAAGLLDDALLGDFETLMRQENALRLALAELLSLEAAEASASGFAAEQEPAWTPLLIAVYAHANSYPIEQLDPHSPPLMHTPAGNVLQQSVQFMRRQVQRGATERDRLGRRLAYDGSTAPALDQLASSEETIAPVPPHFRSPIPVRYPEYGRPVELGEEDLSRPSPDAPSRQPEVKITLDDLPRQETQPPVTITREQVPPRPAAAPQPTGQPSTNSIGHALRQMFSGEPLKATRLRVLVQEFPDGPGLYGLQIKVTSPGIRSFVAGTTDRSGRFLCELPVRARSGLTYDVTVIWPRDFGGETERKSITLHADRTEFVLPFYRRLTPTNPA